MSKLKATGRYILAIGMGVLLYNCSNDDSIGLQRIIVEEEEVEKVIVKFEEPLGTIIELKPGDDIQAAIDELHNDLVGGSVLLGEGTYVLDTTLVVYSNINIHGASSEDPSATILTIEDDAYNYPIIGNSGPFYNVSLQDFKIQGNLLDSEQHLAPFYHDDGIAAIDDSVRSDLMGILLTAGGSTYSEAEIKNLKLTNIEVSNCAMGIHVKGARDVFVTELNLHDNGMIESYYHNLYFRRVFQFTISDSKMYDSSTGNGMNVSQSEDVTLINNECYSNFFRGFRVEGETVNDVPYIINKITIENNTCTDNGTIGIRLRNITAGQVEGNTSTNNTIDTDFANISEVTFTGNSWD